MNNDDDNYDNDADYTDNADKSNDDNVYDYDNHNHTLDKSP